MTTDDVVHDDVVVVGRIGGPYGVKGWVHLQSFTTPAENLLDYQPWWVKTATGDWQQLAKPACRKHKNGFVALLEGVADRDAAAGLNGQLLGVLANVLPPLADLDEFYWRELEGCEVIDTTGKTLGRVDHLLETGANDVLVILADSGQQVLIPFVAQYVQAVDRQKRVIRVDWDEQW